MLLQVFKDESFKVRVLEDAENPLFVAKDICDALEYSDAEVALRKLDHFIYQLIEQTSGLANFYKNIKSLPSFERYEESHKKIYAEIENIKRLICYENPTLYKKDLKMYTEDIELFFSIYTLLLSETNKKITMRNKKWNY